MTARRWFSFWTAVLLVTALASSCQVTQKQWERTRGPLFGTSLATLGGILASALSGGLGLAVAVAVAGTLGGAVLNRTLEPEPEVRTIEKFTVVQTPPSNPDGTPGQPRVDSYTIQGDGTPLHDGARGNLKLPIPDLPGLKLPPMPLPGFWERVWFAFQVVWWVFVAGYVLLHPKLRGMLFGAVQWLWEAAGRKARQLLALIPRKKKSAPAAPGGAEARDKGTGGG